MKADTGLISMSIPNATAVSGCCHPRHAACQGENDSAAGGAYPTSPLNIPAGAFFNVAWCGVMIRTADKITTDVAILSAPGGEVALSHDSPESG